MQAKRWLSCALLFLATYSLVQSGPAQQQAPGAPQNELKMVVILSRHGVRSPLSVPQAENSWPQNQRDWSVDCCGDLTPSGEQLVRQMGAYYHLYYASKDKKLLPEGCPDKEVYIWADNEERTIQTGRELAQGLAGHSPGCSLVVYSLPYEPSACTLSPNDKTCQRKSSTDPLFHPDSTFERAPLQAIADDINRRYKDLVEQYRNPLDALQKTLCPTGNCLAGVDQPASVSDEGGKPKLKWNGRFSIGSTASEIFLLEYAHGMPCANVGWGKVVFNQPDCGQGQSFRQMQELHTAYFQETQRAPYIAKMQGAPLLNEIAGRLSQGMQGKPPAQKVVIFAGHDTNIANVAAMLGVCWKLPDLPENDTPPAGALVFELYRNSQTGKYSLHIRYVYQMLGQLRTKADLTLQHPPRWIEVAVPRCKGNCDLKTFNQMVANPASERQACTVRNPK